MSDVNVIFHESGIHVSSVCADEVFKYLINFLLMYLDDMSCGVDFAPV